MNRKELLAAGGIAAALTFGWYQFVWQPQGAAAAKATKDRAAAEQTATKLKAQVAALQRTQADLAGQKASVDLINQAIPAAADQSSLLKLLQSRADELGVVITTIGNGQVTNVVVPVASGQTAPDKANEMTLSIAMHGTYEHVVSYIKTLYDLPRLVVVDSVTLQPVQSQAKPGEAVPKDQISVNVAARVFTTAEPPVAAGTPTTTAAAKATTPTTAAGAKAGASQPQP